MLPFWSDANWAFRSICVNKLWFTNDVFRLVCFAKVYKHVRPIWLHQTHSNGAFLVMHVLLLSVLAESAIETVQPFLVLWSVSNWPSRRRISSCQYRFMVQCISWTSWTVEVIRSCWPIWNISGFHSGEGQLIRLDGARHYTSCLTSPSADTEEDDDVGLHVLGCRVDILGTNCTTADSFFIHCNKGVCWNHHVCLHVQLCPDFFWNAQPNLVRWCLVVVLSVMQKHWLLSPASHCHRSN